MFLQHLPKWKVCQPFEQLEMCWEKHHSLSGSIVCDTSDRFLPREMAKKKIKIKTPGVQEREKSAGFSFQHLTVVSEQSCDHFSSALWTVLCDCQWFGHWGKQRASRKPGTQAWDSAALWQSTESWWLPSLSSWSLRTVTSRMSHVSGAWDVLAVTLPWGWLLHGKKGS